MKKVLVLFRLFDSCYGERGNPETLSVYLQEDGNSLGYSLYGGWQNSGTPFAISNLQMEKSLPVSIYEYKERGNSLVKTKRFKSVLGLVYEIKQTLATGCGSNRIKTYEIINEIYKKGE